MRLIFIFICYCWMAWRVCIESILCFRLVWFTVITYIVESIVCPHIGIWLKRRMHAFIRFVQTSKRPKLWYMFYSLSMLCVFRLISWCALVFQQKLIIHRKSFSLCSNIRCNRSSLKIIHLNSTEQKTRNAHKTQSFTHTQRQSQLIGHAFSSNISTSSFTIQHSTNGSFV